MALVRVKCGSTWMSVAQRRVDAETGLALIDPEALLLSSDVSTGLFLILIE
jgi:hypothetical protein